MTRSRQRLKNFERLQYRAHRRSVHRSVRRQNDAAQDDQDVPSSTASRPQDAASQSSGNNDQAAQANNDQAGQDETNGSPSQAASSQQVTQETSSTEQQEPVQPVDKPATNDDGKPKVTKRKVSNGKTDDAANKITNPKLRALLKGQKVPRKSNNGPQLHMGSSKRTFYSL